MPGEEVPPNSAAAEKVPPNSAAPPADKGGDDGSHGLAKAGYGFELGRGPGGGVVASTLVDAFDQALRVIASLDEAGVDYVVVGGVAINLHGLVRATEDLDLFVRPDADNIARLRRALASVWADPDIEEITAADLCGDYPAVRYGPPDGSLYLDILTRLGDAFEYSDIESQDVEIDGVRVRVATPRALYLMKKDTVRPIDHADAVALRAAFELPEEEP